jgi:putative PIN family toxin of toxin-antitoxin system
MRVVIDTNVVVSAALKDRDPEAVILFVLQHPDFEWVASFQIVDEYVSVLRRKKFGLPDSIVKRWTDMFGELLSVVDVGGVVEFPRDRKDAMFLSCALSSDAEYFITGDKDFGGVRKIGNTTVLSVSLFNKHVCNCQL